jgi:hypothetical protein
MGGYRVILACGCGKADPPPQGPVPDPPPTTGIEGETGAAQ